MLDDAPVDLPRPRTIAATYEPAFAARTQTLRELIVGANRAAVAEAA